MSELPKVSVIIPIYNDEQDLHRSLSSVKCQTLADIEIILVNDGSTDGSVVIMEEYAASDSRFKIVNRENGGGGAARNTGMEYAFGKYLSFLDGDDYFYPTLLEDLYNKAEEDNSEVSFCLVEVPDPAVPDNTVFIKPAWTVIEKYIPKEPFAFCDLQSSFRVIAPNIWNKLWLREFIITNNIRFSETRICNDAVFHYIALMKSKRISFVDKVLVRYWNNLPDNTKSKYNLYWREFVSNWAQITEYCKKYATPQQVEQIALRNLIEFYGWLMKAITDEVELEAFYNYLLSEGLDKFEISKLNFDRISMKRIYFWAWQRLQRMMEFKPGEYKLYKKSLEEKPVITSIIPIIFATDENYALPLTTALISMLENQSTNTFYDIYVFTPEEFSQSMKEVITEYITNKYKFCEISFVGIAESYFQNAVFNNKHLSKVAFYRFLIPDILTDYNKAIYIDVDTVIRHDLAPLYNKVMKTNLFGAVRSSIYLFMPNKSWSDRLGMDDLSKYVNDGVLLMNLKKIREENITKSFINLADEEFRYEDQDIINKVSAGRISFIEPKYNAMLPNLLPENYKFRKLSQVYSKSEYDDMVTNPVIIHYISSHKPWNEFDSFYVVEWFKYAEKSPLFNEIYFANYKAYICYKKVTEAVATIKFFKNRVPLPDYKSSENIKISLIIPLYNAEATLHQTMQSAIISTEVLGNCEIIIINDGSTDNSLKIAKTYAFKFLNIMLLSQANEGSGAARNAGLCAANGEYVAFIDSDDYYPDYCCLEKLYNAAKDKNALICGGSWMELRKGKFIEKKFDYFPLQGYTFMDDGFVDYRDYQFDFGYHRFIYNREFLQKSNISFPLNRRYQDVPFFIKAMLAAKQFYALSIPTYIYRVDEAKTIWDERNTVDLLKGIHNVLILAKMNGLEELYRLTYQRYLDYERFFITSAMKNKKLTDIFIAHIRLIKSLDYEILGKYGINKYDISLKRLVNAYHPFISIGHVLKEIKEEIANG